MTEKQKKKALLSIFIVILADIIGYGMIIPLTPILAREFGADGLKIGLLISSYSFIQFLVAPFWGRLSDIFGRKPVFLFGLLGSSISYMFFAFSDSFTQILISRMLAGFFGGNIAIAMAYIADVTSEQNRSKNMGLIGMAFGLGFSLGPIFGFLLIIFGGKLGSIPPFGDNFPALGASLFCFINFIMSFFFLRESLILPKSQKKKPSVFTRPSFFLIWKSLKTPKLGRILIMSFILLFSLAQIEPVLILLVQDDFGWTKTTAYGSFIYIGFMMVVTQGYLVRKWIPRWGESFVNQNGLFLMSFGLLLIAIASWISSPSSLLSVAFFVLFFGVTFFSLGYSLSNTNLNGALSLLSPRTSQGSIFGVNRSLSALARILGPVMGGWFYRDFSHASPFFIGSFFAFFALVLALISKKDFPNKGLSKK